MSMLSKMKKKTEENRVGNNHPLLSMGVSRNLQDAYLDEIVFASFADDEQIDESERDYLAKVGRALGIPTGEVEETINAFVAADSDGKITRAMESAKTLAGSGLANILLCEFSLVWTSHGQDLTELDECRRQVAEWMDVKGFDYDEKFFAVFDEVSAKVKDDPTAVYALYDYLDDDVIRYLFADIFEIERIFAEKRDAENRAVLPHPLKTALDDAQKACYLSAVLRAVNETSDNAPTKMQQKGLRHLAVALGVKDAGEATEEKEITLSTDSAMRSLAFFRYCDMARLFAMDGRPSFSAAQKQALEEVVTAFKLVPEDIAFLKEYSAYLGNGKEPDVAEVVRDAQSKIRFPDGFIRYFTPNMKPIVLAGGDTAPGIFQIVDGHYRLEHLLKVGSQTTLVIENAIVDFLPEAKIEFCKCKVEISNSKFNGEKTDDNGLKTQPFFCGDLGYESVVVTKCCFNGAGSRSAIMLDHIHRLTLEGCQFNGLLGGDLPIVGVPRKVFDYNDYSGSMCAYPVLKSYKTIWSNCHADNDFFAAGTIELESCDFEVCTSKTFADVLCRPCLTIIACLFDKCRWDETYGLCDYNCYIYFKGGDNTRIENNYYGENGAKFSLKQLREVREKIEREQTGKKS